MTFPLPSTPERGICDPRIEEEPEYMPEEVPAYIPEEEPIPVELPERAVIW